MPASPSTSPLRAGEERTLTEESPLQQIISAEYFWSKCCFPRLPGMEGFHGSIMWEMWKSAYSDSKNKNKCIPKKAMF